MYHSYFIIIVHQFFHQRLNRPRHLLGHVGVLGHEGMLGHGYPVDSPILEKYFETHLTFGHNSLSWTDLEM